MLLYYTKQRDSFTKISKAVSLLPGSLSVLTKAGIVAQGQSLLLWGAALHPRILSIFVTGRKQPPPHLRTIPKAPRSSGYQP